MILKILFVIVSVIVVVNGKANRVPWWQLKVTKSQGPNACIVEEVPELNKKYYTECKYWPVRKVCGKETIVRYECCEGYQQIREEEGCIGVKPLKNILDTARDLGATKFVRYLEDAGMANELSREGTFTLFAPLDSAFETSSGAIVAMKIETFLRNQENPVLRYHISTSKYPSKDFSGNTEIESIYQQRKLRISKYSTGMETVNCVLISRKDQEATNGIVHIIDHPLDPTVFVPRDIAQVVVDDGRFTKMAGAMQRCGFMNRLRESGKSYTLLAPSDEAFLKIPPARLEKMFSDRAACTALLENHVIPHVMCMPVITDEYKARSIGSEKVAFDCDPDKGHVVEGRKVVGDFILGENGVLYMLDDVIIPDRTRTILELAEKYHLSTFAQLARVAGLDETLNDFGEYTYFVPSEAAWYSIDSELLEEAKQNPDLARSILLYHGTQGRILTNKIKNNQVAVSLDEENSLRLQLYRKSFGVEDAVIEKADIEGMNGVLHIITKVIFPASESAGDILRKSGNYSMFLQTMETILADDPDAIDIRRGGQASNHYTFFVPTDDAFRSLGASRLRRLQSDQTYMTKVIKNHISSSMMSSDSFRPDLIYDLPTRQNAVGVTCDKSKKMKVNDAGVLKKDIMSSTGVIHVIDSLLLPENDRY